MPAPAPRGGARPGAGRPRKPGADTAILRSATQLLSEVGPRGLTMEDVAERSGTSLGSVYRRWPTKSALLAAALRERLGPSEPVDTGTLRGDLEAIGNDVVAFFAGQQGQLAAAVLAGAEGDPELLAAVRDSATPRREGLRAIIRRAISRGEVPGDVDVDLAIDLFVGPLWTRLLVTGRPITRPVVRRLSALTAAALTG